MWLIFSIHVGCSAVLGVPHELGQSVGADLLPTRAPGSAQRALGLSPAPASPCLGVDGGAEFLGGDRGRGEADDGAAGVLPGAGEDLHGGGLAGAGGREGELDGAAAGGHLADQGLLGGVELELVGGGFGDRDADADLADGAAAGAAGGLDDAPFGVDDGLGGVLAGAGEAVDADDLLAVAAALGALQGSGDRHVQLGRGGGVGERVGVVEGDGVVGDRGGDDAVDGGVEVGQPDAVGAGLALCLGAQVPDLPGRAVLGDPLDDALRGLGDPLVGDVLGVRRCARGRSRPCPGRPARRR